MENKSTLITGKLTGTRTLASELNQIEQPDEIEQFLKEFIQMKFDVSDANNMIEARTEKEAANAASELSLDDAVAVYTNKYFSWMYITTKDQTTYKIKISRSNLSAISSFLSSEKPVKYVLNGFPLLKWCHHKEIEPKNIYDIMVYIKLLTNDVDPFMTPQDYIQKYSNRDVFLVNEESETEEDKYVEYAFIGNFIYQFGEYLAQYTSKLGLDSLSKMVNENSYYEGMIEAKGDEQLCSIQFSYIDLNQFISENQEKYASQYDGKAYMKSPLGRIALKFGNKESELVEELIKDDLEIQILNELYSNNMKVLVLDENLYEVTCKYKSFSSVISLITAILKDTFYHLFDEKIEVKLECVVKE